MAIFHQQSSATAKVKLLINLGSQPSIQAEMSTTATSGLSTAPPSLSSAWDRRIEDSPSSHRHLDNSSNSTATSNGGCSFDFGDADQARPRGLFGSTPSDGFTSAGLFGSSNPSQITSRGGLFGSSSSSASATSGSLYGTAHSTATSSGGLFGSSNPNQIISGGGLFGSAPSNTAASSRGLFGSSHSNQITSGGGLFGSSSSASATSGSMFGTAHSTAASSEGLFGNIINTPAPSGFGSLRGLEKYLPPSPVHCPGGSNRCPTCQGPVN